MKALVVVVGSIVSAYGMDLAIHAGFGGATLAVLWQGVATTFGITIGQASLAVAVAMIAFCCVYDCSQIGIGTVLYQIVYSWFIDVFSDALFYTGNTAFDCALMVAGIAVFAFGTALYSCTDLGRGSYEGVTFVLAERSGFSVGAVRTVLDFSCVAGGLVLGGTFGACTVVTILGSGVMIQFWLKRFTKVKALRFA